MDDVLKLADRFFTAIEAGDIETVREIYAPNAVIWHNFDGLEERARGQSPEENLKVLEGLPQRIRGPRYEVLQRERTETGFVQQHVLRGKTVHGRYFALPACIICVVQAGRITRLDEYFDPALREQLR